MGVATQFRPAELLDFNDSPALIRLFSETLTLADAAASGQPRFSMLPPGPFWLLSDRTPSRDDIARLFRGEVPESWPSWFQRNAEWMQNHAVSTAFLHCFEAAPRNGVESTQDVCRVMAAVAQTLFSTNADIVARNRNLAGLRVQVTVQVETPGDEWSDEEHFISRRPDESGGSVSVDRLTLWMASHLGPDYADKIENQDAVYACGCCGNGIAFALADGVSTSLGSRFAAALAAFRFCRALRELERNAPQSPSALIEAVATTQRGMDSVLKRLLDDPFCPAMEQILSASRMPARTVHAVLENTRTAEKTSLLPALATTLIGGLIRPSSVAGSFTASVICLGDGVVEKISLGGQFQQIIATDPEISEITHSMSPGPLAAKFIRSGKLAPVTIDMRQGDHLLVSSDGLARGHSGPVWPMIEELAGDIRARLQRGIADSTAILLRDVTAKASELRNSRHLFDDNVSLILISAG